jgi:predicted ABC-type ATPase
VAFLALPDPEMALARVAERVREGGHNVPKDVVRRRFGSGLRNFFALYQGVADTWQLFDNSGLAFHLIASGRAGEAPEIHDLEAWNNLMERQR